MSRYYRVSPKFWLDAQRWDDDSKLLALYLLSCPHRTTEGLFRLPKAYITADLGWDSQRLSKPFAILLADGFIGYDEETQIILIRKALKYQRPDNGNQQTAALRALKELPETHLWTDFLQLAKAFAEPFYKALVKEFGEDIPNSPSPSLSQDPETDAYASAHAADADVPEDGTSTGADSLGTVPKVMLGPIHHLLAVTGRQRETFTGEERGAAQELRQWHTAGAVISEINRAVERFKRKRRDLTELTLVYILESLAPRGPTIPHKRAEWQRARDQPRNPLLEDLMHGQPS